MERKIRSGISERTVHYKVRMMGGIIISFLLLISSLWITAVKEDKQKSLVHKINIAKERENIFTCKVFRNGPHQELNGPLMITINMPSTNNEMYLECKVEGFFPEDFVLTWMKNDQIIP